MTKRNLTLGSASGKLGSTVYMRRRGQQIARLLVSSPADPRTRSQCLQRAKFANYVSLWRLLRPYVGDTWRGVSRYGSSENAFFHHNRGLMPTASRGMSRSGSAFPSLGIISYGGLAVNVPLLARRVTGTASYRGIMPFSIVAQNVVAPPQDVVSLFNIFQLSSIGIDDSDRIHIVAMAYGSSDSVNSAVESAEQYAPKTYGVVLSKDALGISLSSAAPWLRAEPAITSDGVATLGLDIIENFLPETPDLGYVDYVMALFVERPSNPQFARFSRSRFLADSDVMATLRSLCGDTPLSNKFASTFKNI